MTSDRRLRNWTLAGVWLATSHLPQSIASGVLGAEAFAGGAASAALGVALHFLIALGAAAVYVLASRPMGVLRVRWLASGLIYGVVVYAVMQGVVASGAAYWLLDLDTTGSAWLVVLVAVVDAILGVALGLLCSAFARTEFQAVQFLPVVVVPQTLLCGLFVPRDQMAGWLEAISNALPLTYAVDALIQVGRFVDATSTMWRDLAVVAGAALVALILAAATLRRRTP